MLNIPLFLIRQYQFTIRCKGSIAIENQPHCKLVFIKRLQNGKNNHVKISWGISLNFPYAWFLRVKRSI
jgi:hypothetical protein